MSKYLEGNYLQFPRIFWDKIHNGKIIERSRYRELSVNAKWMYTTLKNMEHTYTGKENDASTIFYEGVKNNKNWFYIETERLAYQCGMSESSVRRAKKELISCGLIDTCKVYFIDKYGNKSLKWVCGYYIFDGKDPFY